MTPHIIFSCSPSFYRKAKRISPYNIDMLVQWGRTHPSGLLPSVIAFGHDAARFDYVSPTIQSDVLMLLPRGSVICSLSSHFCADSPGSLLMQIFISLSIFIEEINKILRGMPICDIMIDGIGLPLKKRFIYPSTRQLSQPLIFIEKNWKCNIVINGFSL